MTANTGLLDDTADMDDLLTWINNGEFGSSTADGGLSALSGRGKAGIAPLGISSLFQKRDPGPTVLPTMWKLTICSPALMVSLWSAEMAGPCPHRAGVGRLPSLFWGMFCFSRSSECSGQLQK